MILAQLLISKIRRDPACQPRAYFNEDHAERIGDYLLSGGKGLPPVIVFRGSDGDVLADGWHRCKGHEFAGMRYIEAEIRQGTIRDAILFAIEQNVKHTALTWTDHDKQKAARLLLADPEWSKWSATKIAHLAGYKTHDPVTRLRKQREETDRAAEPESASGGERRMQQREKEVKFERNGQEHTMRLRPRDMTPEQQAEAIQGETERYHRKLIGQADGNLKAARQNLVECGGFVAESIRHIDAALAALPD